MKILLSYASEHDQGEGIHFSTVLRRMGHTVMDLNVACDATGLNAPGRVVRGYPATARLSDLLEDTGAADLYLYVEPMGLIPQGLEKAPIPTACVISDCHRSLRPRQQLAKFFDHIFLYQRNYLRSFIEHPSSNIHWLPYACDTKFFRDLRMARDLDVAFIGKLMEPRSERRRALALISRRCQVNEQRYYLQKEIPAVYSRSKIVLNIPLGDDLNFRFFEALSCGALLLTKRLSNGQDDLFKEGLHYEAFSTEAEMLDKVDYYLNHQEERERIAAAGHTEVLSRHDLELRLNGLLETIQAGPKNAAPIRRLSSQQVLSLYAAAYERSGRVDALLGLVAKHRSDRSLRRRLIGFALKSMMRRTLFVR
jgi:spore maturation protein CgeB